MVKIDRSEMKIMQSAQVNTSNKEVVASSINSLGEALKAQKARKAEQELFAIYGRPDGLFFEGYSRGYRYYLASYMHYPAVAPLIYEPYVNDAEADVKWVYNNPSRDIDAMDEIEDGIDEDYVLSFESNITPAGYISFVPHIVAINSADTATFVLGEGTEKQYGFASDVARSETKDGTSMDGAWEYPGMTLVNMHLDSVADNFYIGFGGNNRFGPAYSNDKGQCVGVMQVTPPLASPMYVESMTAFVYASDTSIPAGGVLDLELYYINEEGGLSDLIAKASTDEFEMTNAVFGVAIFKFEEEEDGFVTDVPVTLDAGKHIAVIITGFDETWDFAFLFGSNDWEGSAYTLHGENLAISTFAYSNLPGVPAADLYINFNGMFNALDFYFEEDNSFNFPVEGGWGIVGYEGGEAYNDLYVYTAHDVGENMEDLWIEEAPDWIVDFEYDDKYFENNNVIAFFFEADALPEGLNGRSGEIVLASHGIKLSVPVVQGEVSGLNPVKDKDVRVASLSHGISVKYPQAYNQLSMFNTAGQLLGSYALPSSGEFVVPTSNERGIYILKLEGTKSTTVKFVR